MTIKEFNNEIINQGFAQTDKHIVFQTPDGKVYTNAEIISITQGNEVICKVKLNDKIEPKFKVGDVVTNSSGLYPDVKCTITTVDKEKQCYYFKEVAGTTNFKDQDKLTLVNDNNVPPPVEGNINSSSVVKINPNIIPADDLNINKDIYDKYTLIVQEMMCAIKRDAKQGKSKAHFIISVRDISVFKLGQDFNNAGYKVSAVIVNDKNSTLDIEW